MEYCGEVISPVEFEERKKLYTIEKRRHYYFMSLRSDEVRYILCLHVVSGMYMEGVFAKVRTVSHGFACCVCIELYTYAVKIYVCIHTTTLYHFAMVT